MASLPDDFLSSPAPDIIVDRIDFAKSTLPCYADLYAVVLDNVLSPEECKRFISAAEGTTNGEWERAMINIGGGRQELHTDARNCGRIIWDSREIVAKIWKRIEHLPEVREIVRLENVPTIFGNGPAKRGEIWTLTRPNERMRFLKYVGGEYFRPHCDGAYETPDKKERSYFTMHLYLNSGGVLSKEELAKLSAEYRKNVLIGGATTFHSPNMDRSKDIDVLPKTGRVLIFQHQNLLHSGDDVLRGVKYTMRTDLMYTWDASDNGVKSKLPALDD
ncbi:hypothetical protein CBER1_08817 [Cercospora berteroae]|uniref:Prolyl 4-hydroxylase alpha subunit domain-containing protein n=1 Tax=Cercospora berteroae TaxID=357750 RepID=A0A2S6BVZ7_9PEZI|nr:hypothetical protein CBER1_08817 [Cercospora berteroae]